MSRHDQRFKELLRNFFPDFLRLAVPEAARRLDLAHLKFNDKEFFTNRPEGNRRELDLLAEARVRGRNRGTLLVHVEIERQARHQSAVRLHRYFGQVYAHYGLPTLSILLYLQGGPPGVHRVRLDYLVLGERRGTFTYTAFGLSGSKAEEYLERPEPLAWALAALMRPERLSRPELKLACLRRIARAELDDSRRFLLVHCVQFYLELSPGESAEYASLEVSQRNEEVKTMATNWVERLENKYLREGRKQGREEGRAEGIRKILLRQLALRFGPLPVTVRREVEAISSVERLNRLAEQVVTARSLEEMGLG
jgi:uncharacterized protein DUF4351